MGEVIAMNAALLLTSLTLACYFPTVVIAGPVQTNGPRSMVIYEYIPQCSITGGAALSDCKALVNSLGSTTNLTYNHKCSDTFSSGVAAYNPICSPDGECCIYTTQVTSHPAELKQFGEVILEGCGDEEGNKIHGAVRDEHYNRFCLASASECGSCFH